MMFEIYAFGKKPFFGMTPDKVSILASFVLMIRCGVSVACVSSIPVLGVTVLSCALPGIDQYKHVVYTGALGILLSTASTVYLNYSVPENTVNLQATVCTAAYTYV